MDTINKIFFINLEKCLDRRQHFIKQCEIHNIPFEKIERIEAIDGMSHPFTSSEINMFRKANYLLNPEPIIRKIMGNQLSHYYTMKHIIVNQYKYSIVCQDDVTFSTGFVSFLDNIIENFPENAEMINLGLHKYAEGKEFIAWDFSDSDNDSNKICCRLSNPYVGIWQDDLNPCSLCYIISLEGAIQIVDHFDKYGFRKTTDYNFIDYLVGKSAFYGSSRVLATTNTDFPSEIFK
jgi:GR25 family glycosyltransferase involved in LPS biosynthesis